MILISFPLKAELQLFMDAIKNDNYELIEDSSKGPRVYICPALRWILSYGGHGKTQFAIQTQHVIQSYPQIHSVITAGACGALVDHLKIGDVVIATHTVEHDYKERFSPQPLPRFDASPELLARFDTQSSNVHLGIIASGDEDIVDTKRAKELNEQTQAIAVAWEGAGGARVSKYYKLSFLEVRGVTDNANSNAVSDFKTNLKIAMTALYKALI
jgi:adenosylhomocysteine nucleosidase